MAGQIQQFMDDHYTADVRKGMQGPKDKPYTLFYSHGGGGKVRDAMAGLFKRVGTQVGQAVGARGAPNARALEQCKALGKSLAEAISP